MMNAPNGYRLGDGWGPPPAEGAECCNFPSCEEAAAWKRDEPDERFVDAADEWISVEWSCSDTTHAAALAAVVPVEPSRPGTGEAVPTMADIAAAIRDGSFSSKVGVTSEHPSDRCPTRDDLGIDPTSDNLPAPGKPASRDPGCCSDCHSGVPGDCLCTDTHEGASEMGPGKPDEAPLSELSLAGRLRLAIISESYAYRKEAELALVPEVAALEAKLAANEETEHEYDRRIADMESQLATRTAEVESLREKLRVAEWHSEQDQRDYKRVCEDMKVTRAEVESLRADLSKARFEADCSSEAIGELQRALDENRAAATAQVARIAELERDVAAERENAVTLQDIARREERERVNGWWTWWLVQPINDGPRRDEGITSGAPAPKATP